MRNLYRYLTILFFCASSSAYAWVASVDALYWQVDEPIDWASVSTRNSADNQVSYKSVTFPYRPGFRIGLGYEGDWNTRVYYTGYNTKTTGAATGYISSGFLAARIALLPYSGGVYTAEQVNFKIDYNTLDWDIGKKFQINSALMLEPFVGLRAASIDQTILTTLQGTISVAEHTKNDFSGFGPKVGVSTQLTLLQQDRYKVNLLATFATAYLWGRWVISDVLYFVPPSTGNTIDIGLGDRSFGALAFQAVLGLGVNYKNLTVNLGYEMNDWFNQYQVFDNGTGGHNNDLVLQGLTLNLSYNF